MSFDTLIIGAGGAGLMCAANAGGRVLVIDHAKRPGEKIRISGGGRCNFTNMDVSAENFLSQNPHFCKSAISRYSQWDFIALMDLYGIAWHEKALGQLFCDGSAKQIVAMLLEELEKSNVQLRLETSLIDYDKTEHGFEVRVEKGAVRSIIRAKNLVVATGGKSIPKMGATGIAYEIGQKFGHSLVKTRPALVPLTFGEDRFRPLAGLSTPVRISTPTAAFNDSMLFTHRGLSGPAILQISSFWREGDAISINLFPDTTQSFDPLATLQTERQISGRRQIKTFLAKMLPSRLVDHLAEELQISGNLADQSDIALTALIERLQNWSVIPSGSEGYRTAEVTLGGIDTNGLSSKTMESKSVKGLYFIGECVDVTGWLGGYNFQWAWSSGMAAASAIRGT